MPPKRKTSKSSGVSDRPRDQPSLIVAFAKQITLKRCTICKAEIPSGVFAAHKRDCKVGSDDEECQIILTQTAAEKWAAGLITLDELEEGRENSMRVKKEGETPTTSKGHQSEQSAQRRRATKRKIGEGESGEDDSDFLMGSQESKEAEETTRKREEPVRTRRSGRVNVQAEAVQPVEDGEGEKEQEVDGDEGMGVDGGEEREEEEEEMGDDLEKTVRPADEEEDEDFAAAAAAAPPPPRLTLRRSTKGCKGVVLVNMAYVKLPDNGPDTPESQGSSMEVETGFIPDAEDRSDQRGKRDKRRSGGREAEEEPVDLDATLPPQEDDRVTRRRRRGGKDTAEDENEEILCDTPPPPPERRVTRRGAKEASQSSQSSQEIEGTKKGRKEREEERKRKEEEAKRIEDEEKDKRKKEQKEKEKKKEEERERRRKEDKEKEKEKKKKAEEEEKRRKEEERKRAEEKTKDQQPIAGLTRIVLRALEDKCVRHERGLVPSQELVQAAVITLDEEDPEVVPHYVYLVCKIMRRVLSTRSSSGRVHDETFWGEDLRMVSRFLSLKDDAKLLFIRLFTRKRGWHLPEKLREKYPYLKRLDETLAELHKDGFLENGKSALSSTEETLKLCSIEKLKAIAKDFRVDANKPKPGLIAALLATATSQRQLFVSGTPGNTGRLLAMAKKHLGPVYRTSSSCHSFFRALFSLYSPALTDSHLITEDRTINIISNMMFRMKEIHYEQVMRKAPFPCEELIGVYEDKEDLYGFVEAKEAEERQLRALDSHNVDRALEEAQRARERLGEMKSARIAFLRTVPVHYLQYTTEAILTRIVSRGVDCLERKKDHAAACNWIKFIIKNEVHASLLPHSIGSLYERLALDLHHHCGETEEAIDEIKRALDDPLVPEKNRLTLDDRARRLLKEQWQSRFALTPPTEISIEGETIGRDLGNERKNQFVRKNDDGEVVVVHVEQVALDYFLAKGMEEGLHSEGEVWHLARKLLFYDVIYSHAVGGVWLCELQVQPVDYDHSLYEARKEAFEERFQWLRSSSLSDRLAMVDQHWERADTMCNRVEMKQMKSFLTACDLPTLVGVMEILVKEPRHRRSGFPDLVLWSASKRVITVAEVKGPGDTLSTKQRLWLDFFMKQDKERVKAYLCKVTASGRKRLT